ncbi:hypothetical protein FRC98_10060 [Lujinxingia vulgaris]|uniref:Uncharacterized protein n=1 Tax=Lujinxingia vulgaris TaxID=2600176 RepID=A0A5C6XIH7_9DELT|nr:hypothetical protein [Lujinxingia vulgaris]TXD37072.1 hypothetical protein FRC98_10060 [Lujinxingia vulgaris]
MTQLHAHDDPAAAELLRQAEEHRGYVRAIDQRLAKTYGLGGMPFFIVLAGLPILAAVFGWWTSAMLWIPGVTLALIVLYVGRKAIYERRDRMREQVETYGVTNGVAMKRIAEHFRAEGEYSFFVALYDERSAPALEVNDRAEPGASV